MLRSPHVAKVTIRPQFPETMGDAFAIFGAGGELLGASEPFHALVQSPTLPPRCPPARLLLELGFTPTPDAPDGFQKGAVIVRQRLEPTRTGATLLVLTQAS